MCEAGVDASSEAGACAVVRRALSGKRLATAVLGIPVGEVSASAVGMRAIAVDDFVRALVDEYWRPLVEGG
ncbi:MAG: hypothetical protein D6732_23170 [Methanobacteriota archaeon]|nr:MAG: hypothetical protein D6732_23170 [Euryarchaeota archaeon]